MTDGVRRGERRADSLAARGGGRPARIMEMDLWNSGIHPMTGGLSRPCPLGFNNARPGIDTWQISLKNWWH